MIAISSYKCLLLGDVHAISWQLYSGAMPFSNLITQYTTKSEEQGKLVCLSTQSSLVSSEPNRFVGAGRRATKTFSGYNLVLVKETE